MLVGRVATYSAADAAIGDLDDASRTASARFMGRAGSPIVELVVRIGRIELHALTVLLERPSKFGFRR